MNKTQQKSIVREWPKAFSTFLGHEERCPELVPKAAARGARPGLNGIRKLLTVNVSPLPHQVTAVFY